MSPMSLTEAWLKASGKTNRRKDGKVLVLNKIYLRFCLCVNAHQTPTAPLK